MAQDEIAAVIGGAGGIGSGVVMALVRRGYRVAVIDADADRAAEVAAQAGARAFSLVADATNEDSIAGALEDAAQRGGGLDLLVNCVGGSGETSDQTAIGVPMTDVSLKSWDWQIALNLNSVFLGSRAAMPMIEARKGSIINIASISGLMPQPQIPAYAAAKAAVINLTRSLAYEMAPKGVRVNAVCPGYVWTPAWRAMTKTMGDKIPELKGADPRDVFDATVARTAPLGVAPSPEEIGDLVAYLASPSARAVTGQAICIDGGVMLNYVGN